MERKKIRWEDIPEDFTDFGGTLKVVGPRLEAGQMDIYLGRFEPGESLLPHYHLAPVEEIYYIISGKMTVHAAEDAYEVAAGDVVHVPSGVVHYCVNHSSEPCQALFLLAPHETQPPVVVQP